MWQYPSHGGSTFGTIATFRIRIGFRKKGADDVLTFPAKGRSKEEVLAEMRAARDHDVQWRQGRAFGLVYHISEEIDDLLKEAYTMFFAENGLNPTAFPSLRKFETEVVTLTASLLGGDENVVGTMTSGGTESVLMAVKTARDWARQHQPEIHEPDIVLVLELCIV